MGAALPGASPVGVVVMVGVRLALWMRGGSWLDRRSGERVLVHSTTEQTFEGVVREVNRHGVVLAAVRLVDAGVDVAGEVWVPREKVLFVQRHRAGV